MINIDNSLFVQEEFPMRDGHLHQLKIASVVGQTFANEQDSQPASGFKSYLLVCDPSGCRVRQEQYNSTGQLIYERRYGEKGRLLREIAYEDTGEANYRFELVYNQAEVWQEKQMYLGDQLHYRIVAKRDAQGQLIEENYINAAGQKLRTDIYIYDPQGHLVQVNMGHIGEWLYEYDNAGNLSKKTGNLASADVFGENFEFKYDERGLLIQLHHLNHSTTTFTYTFFT